LIERCAAEVLGRPVVVLFVSGQGTAADDAPPSEAPAPPPRQEDAFSDPFVKKALELFDGRILNVEERNR
jgi:hypothetical protein